MEYLLLNISYGNVFLTLKVLQNVDACGIAKTSKNYFVKHYSQENKNANVR